MKTFTVIVRDAVGERRVTGVTSFVGEDASGSFGILAGHARMMTALVVGLARFRIGESDWRYLALPGAVLYFDRDVLTVATRRHLTSDDYTQISAALEQQLLAEEQELHSIKQSLHRMEEQLLTRVWEIGRASA